MAPARPRAIEASQDVGPLMFWNMVTWYEHPGDHAGDEAQQHCSEHDALLSRSMPYFARYRASRTASTQLQGGGAAVSPGGCTQPLGGQQV